MGKQILAQVVDFRDLTSENKKEVMFYYKERLSSYSDLYTDIGEILLALKTDSNFYICVCAHCHFNRNVRITFYKHGIICNRTSVCIRIHFCIRTAYNVTAEYLRCLNLPQRISVRCINRKAFRTDHLNGILNRDCCRTGTIL